MTRHDDAMVSLTPSSAQAERRDRVAALLEHQCPLTRVRKAEPLGFDAELWRAVTNAAGVDPDDLVSDALVAGVVGAHLAPVPWPEHQAAIRLLRRLNHPEPAGIVTLTVAEPAGHLVPAGAVADSRCHLGR